MFALSQFSGPSYLGAWNRLGIIRQKLCHHYQVRAETKNSPNAFRIGTFLFRSYSFGIEMISTSIHVCSRSSLEKPYPIPDQNGQSVFRPKRPKTPTLLLYKGVPPPPPDPDPFHDCWRPRQGLRMGEENSILIRLMIQRTGQHTSTKNL